MAKYRNGAADFLLLSTISIALITTTVAQCPWQREVPELQSSCLCAYNLGHELSVQCDMVNFQKLLSSLDMYARNTPLDLLYVNNSTISKLDDFIFKNLKIHNIQLSGCKIKSVSLKTFHGQEESLRNLNLQENEITEIPIESLKSLSSLSLLDLSRNRITMVPDGAFKTLKKLATLKLSDNNITLSSNALEGLENTLKNLNLKGTHQRDVPEAIRGLRKLAFLDLSQNGLQELPGENGESSFDGLDSLTALNLERNVIQTLGPTAFDGVKRTLSSLSLLNNLLADFPTEAMSVLRELRVLDIGFNLLTQLPEDAFHGNPSITLLALDGNPLSTVPYKALSHLNSTLRGLSLGGRFLHCDCRLRWVTEWIRNGDLQVTSRERNPQFCGSPPRFRDRGFYNIKPEELTCPGEKLKSPPNKDVKGVASVINPEDAIGTNTGVIDSLRPSVSRSTVRPNMPATILTTPKSTASTTTILTTTSIEMELDTTKNTTFQTSTSSSTTALPNTTQKELTTRFETTSSKGTPMPPWRHNNKPQQQHQRPPLVRGSGFPMRTKHDDSNEVIVKNAFRQDNSVIIQWGSETANILGFRVVYRLFGDKSFKQGPPLEASEREFKIKNVPAQECIVVCVISLEEINVTPENVPYSQCREVRTVASSTSNMDKITIAASAAICGTIVIAVIVFIAASRRRSRKMHDLQQQQLGVKSGLPISGLPVNCCTASSPGGHLSSLATLNAYNTHKEWDQISAYSGRSVQRPRIYTVDQPNSINATMLPPDDIRSHGGSHFSNKGSGGAKTRSLADGQSQHSFSNHSGRYLAPSAFPSNLVTTRQELRHSRQSLAAGSDRMSRTSYPPSQVTTATATAGSTGGGGRRTRPRSRTRGEQRPGSRYSTAGSSHTLNNYCDTSDNWTDHDMDIYMARNPTTRGGLVPL